MLARVYNFAVFQAYAYTYDRQGNILSKTEKGIEYLSQGLYELGEAFIDGVVMVANDIYEQLSDFFKRIKNIIFG